MKLVIVLLVVWQLYNIEASIIKWNTKDSDSKLCDSTEICINVQSCPLYTKQFQGQKRDSSIVAELQMKYCGTDNDHSNKSSKVCCLRSSLPQSTETPRQNLESKFVNQTNNFRECGKTQKEKPLIVGGRNASLDDWPWMAALAYSSQTKNGVTFLCGGSLISQHWILTAAHCIVKTLEVGFKLEFVRLGDLDLNDTINDGANPIDYLVDNITVHPGYKSVDTLKDDLALLHLQIPVQFTKHIHPICLFNGSQYRKDEYYEGTKPNIIGWGRKGYYADKTSSVLQEAIVEIVDRKKCAQLYAEVSKQKINDKLICARGLGSDTCQGDSGGPLAFPNVTDGRYYLGGVVSAGYKCATKVPGLYVKVADYMDWIINVTGEKF